MKIIIDTDKKSVEVPNNIREAYNNISKECGNISVLDMVNVDIKNYKVVSKQVAKVVGDKTTAKDIENYMNKIKESNKDLYEEYVTLKNKIIKTTAKGTKIKTNFLTIKKWFYSKFPDQNPNKKA